MNAGKFAANLYNQVSAKIEDGQLEDLPVVRFAESNSLRNL